MNVLSLFTGMACDRIALRELGITPLRYYASEIDKHAIRQTQLNFPDAIQLGDVTKWREWDIDWASIDIVFAGSPCQGFSFAGKQLAFDDPRSALFFVFIDILNHVRKLNPDVLFLLENVNMKKSHLKVINDYCGLHGARINSSLVSAQMRDRWYWSNIRTRQDGLFGEIYTDIPQPEDRGIFLRDILEPKVDEKYYLSDKVMRRLLGCGERVRYSDDKAACLTTAGSGNNSDMNIIIQRPRGKNKGGIHTNKAPTLSANAWGQNNLVIQLNPSKESGGQQPYQQNRIYDPRGKGPALCAEMSCGSHAVVIGNIYDNGHNCQSGRVYSIHGKSATLNAEAGGGGAKTGLYLLGYRIRRLTPTECARLQTVPEWYRWECSETQQYKMLGNGWTIEVIKHILSFMPNIEKYRNVKRNRPATSDLLHYQHIQ